jgi:predicted RNase H-like HicB family nuclease
MEYTVVLEPQEEGGYFVQCVELPGAISQGDSKEEALTNIKEAIELVLEVQREELHKKTTTFHSEIIKVDVANVS